MHIFYKWMNFIAHPFMSSIIISFIIFISIFVSFAESKPRTLNYKPEQKVIVKEVIVPLPAKKVVITKVIQKSTDKVCSTNPLVWHIPLGSKRIYVEYQDSNGKKVFDREFGVDPKHRIRIFASKR